MNLKTLKKEALLVEAERLKSELADATAKLRELSEAAERVDVPAPAAPVVESAQANGIGFDSLPEIADWAERYRVEVAEAVQESNVFVATYAALRDAATNLAQLINERGHTGVP